MLLAHGGHAPGGAGAAGWLLVVLVVVVPAIAYCRAVRARRVAGRDWPAARTAGFVVGLVLVAVAVSPALNELGRHDPRGHVVQHLLLGMFAPVALVLAAPVTLLLGVLPMGCRGTVRRVLRSRVVHGLAHPATAAVLDMGGLYLLHLTPLYGLMTTNALALVNLHFLLAGCLFTWSIAGPDPAPRRPTIAVRALVLVVAGAAHAHLAKLLYAQALEGSRGPEVQEAAQLMYYGGDLAEIALAVALFATWYRTNRIRASRVRADAAGYPDSATGVCGGGADAGDGVPGAVQDPGRGEGRTAHRAPERCDRPRDARGDLRL